MRYFDNISSMSDLKKAYRKLAMEFHPDRHPGEESKYNSIMQEINDQYTEAFNRVKAGLGAQQQDAQRDNGDAGYYANETADDLIRVINELLKLERITIEIRGVWVWVYGETYACKETLKALGLKYKAKDKEWYYKPGGNYIRHGKAWNKDQIRAKYGYYKLVDGSRSNDDGESMSKRRSA